MPLSDYASKAMPDLVFFCDLSHSFLELLVMADSRYNESARGHYLENQKADPNDLPSWLVYRTKQEGYTQFTAAQEKNHDLPITKPQARVFRPTGNTWEYANSVSFTCRKCDLKALPIDKSDLAKWLDPLIDSGEIQQGNKGDFLVCLSEVWSQFCAIDRVTLENAIRQRAGH